MAAFPPPWELGCGPADPAISNVTTQAPTGNGYARPVGKGTIGAGNVVTTQPGSPPAQIRAYLGSDGNLYFLDNTTGKAYVVSPGALVPAPAVYSPTK